MTPTQTLFRYSDTLDNLDGKVSINSDGQAKI